jgi:tetratricopeptide (TPR) repeat protein
VFRRHHRLALLALALGVVGAGVGAVFLWAQYHLDAARGALDRYAFDEARRHLDLCMKVRPGSAAVHLLAAQAARRCDAYEEAGQHLATCIEIGGMTEATSLERLLLTAQQGNLSGVEGRLQARAADEGDPEAVLVLEALAKGYVNCFWRSHALVCLNILLGRQPRHPQAVLMRARLWEDRARKGEVERDRDALRDYEQAVELSPTFEARLGLAGALYRVGRPWDALREYERLRPARAAHPDVLLGLARCRYALHEVDEARRLVDELLGRHPDHAAALLERGRLGLHAGQLAEAEGWLRRAAEAAPRHDCEALRALGRCLEAQHKTEDARRCLDRLGEREADVLGLERRVLQANREPGNVTLRWEVGRELMRLGRDEDAVGVLLFVVEQQPRLGPAHAALADYFERTGQPDRAARHRRASFPSPVRP